MASFRSAAIINTNPDLVELLKADADIRAGLDVGAILSQHRPEASCTTS